MKLVWSAALALVIAAATACGIDPAKIPATHVYTDDGADIDGGDALSFAVVGATRVPVTGRGEPEIPVQTIADLRGEIATRGISFTVLTGNYVGRSTTKEWASFAERWSPVLRGEVIDENTSRIQALPMPGAGEVLGDKALTGFGAAFPDVGADIGFGRVSSWSHFDAAVGGTRWRFVFVDSNKKALGSRWNEQLFWLPKVVSGDDFDKLLVFMPDPLVTVAKGGAADRHDGPSELLAVIEEHSGLMKLMGVFSGGSASNEVLLPGGEFGELHVVAANAGIGAATLLHEAPAAGGEVVALEPTYLGVLDARFRQWAAALELDEKVVAKVDGADGAAPELPGADFPVQGWWLVDIQGELLGVSFRMRQHDGAYAYVYRAVWAPKRGWKTTAL